MKRRVLIAGIAVVCWLVAYPLQYARAFTVLWGETEGEANTENCSSGERYSCQSDWNPNATSSDMIRAQGHTISAVWPDIIGFGEYTTAYYSAAQGYFSSAYIPNFSWSGNVNTCNNMTLVMASKTYAGITINNSGLIGGLDENLGDFGCSGDNWPCWRVPYQTTYHVPGLTQPLHVIELVTDPKSISACDNNAEMYSLSNWVATTYLSRYPNDPYIIIADLNQSWRDNTNTGVAALASTACGLSIAPCNYPDRTSSFHTSGTSDNPSTWPGTQLDYILVCDSLLNKVRISHCYRDTNGPTSTGVASDHYYPYCTIGSLPPDVINLGSTLQVSTVGAPTKIINDSGTGASVITTTNCTPDFISGSGGSWSGWTSLSILQHAEKAVGCLNQNGTAQMFAIGQDQHVYTMNASDGWSTSTDLGAPGSGEPAGVVDIAVIQDPNSDTIQLFAIGEDGALWNNSESGLNTYTNWTGWSSIGGSQLTVASCLTVGHEADGSLHVFYIGGNGLVYHRYWTGSAWSSSSSLGASTVQSIALIQTGTTLELFDVDSSGNVNRNWETAANSPTSWHGSTATYTGYGASTISAVPSDGTNGQDVFFNGSDGTIYRGSKTSSWQTPVSMGGNTDALTAIQRTDGCNEVFHVGRNGHVYEKYQSTPGGSWTSSWSSLGGNEL